MIKKILLMLLFLSLSAFSQFDINSFPLWGSEWVVAQGDNPKVFTTLSPARPQWLAILNFKADKKNVVVDCVNLNHRYFTCTADMLGEVSNQLSTQYRAIPTTSINKDSILNIAYMPFNDSTWSIDESLADSLRTGKWVMAYRKSGSGTDSFTSAAEILAKPLSEKPKPIGYLKRLRIQSDGDKYSLSMTNTANNETQYIENKQVEASPFTDYCTNQYCYIGIYNYTVHTAGVGFWVVHYFPDVRYFPRDNGTGKAIIRPELVMDYPKALSMKRKSLDDPTSIDLLNYRNPVLDDSSSTIISFAFADYGSPTNPTNRMSSIWLSASQSGSVMDFEHFPPKMYRVGTEPGSNIYNAILQLYTVSEKEESLMASLSSRCPSWYQYDIAASKYTFPYNVRTGAVFKRNTAINPAIFTYNDCPCIYDSKYNMTPAQLRVFLNKPLPTCNYVSMQHAYQFYTDLLGILKAEEDQIVIKSRMTALLEIIKNRYNIYQTCGKSYSELQTNEQKNCPPSWVDNLP